MGRSDAAMTTHGRAELPFQPPIDEVLLGDCVEVMNSMPAASVDLVFADPPYNLQLSGGLLRPDLTEVDAADDEWDQFGSGDGDQHSSFAAYDAFTRAWLTAARRVMKDTATIWVIGSYHNIHRVGVALMDLGFWILNDVVWVKLNPTPQMKGVRFCNAHDTLIWARRDRKGPSYSFPYRDLKASNDDRQLRSDWYLPVCAGSERVTVNGQKAHSAQKPEALLYRVITSSSSPGDTVFDPFCGTGTTAAVAKRLGRRFLTVDSDPGYVAVARERLTRTSCALVDGGGRSVDAPPARVPFRQLVELGLIAPGAKLGLNRTSDVATVNSDGTITAGGHRGSIHKVGKLCLGTPACNGWEHWYVVGDGASEQVSINALRKRAAEMMGLSSDMEA